MEGKCGSYDTYYGQFEGRGIKFPLKKPHPPGVRCPLVDPQRDPAYVCMECTHQIIRSCTMTTHSTHSIPLCSEGPQ